MKTLLSTPKNDPFTHFSWKLHKGQETEKAKLTTQSNQQQTAVH